MKKVIASALAATIGFTAVAGAQSSNFFKESETKYQQLLQSDNEKQLECLAMNIYFETMAVSMADAMAVSDVVQNRVESIHYPNTICEVVHQGKTKPSWKDPNKMVMVRDACQFSWYCDGKADTPTNSEAWERSRRYAHQFFYYGLYKGITEGSTHYHANYVKPYWAPTLDRVTRIGAHIFYRKK